MQHVHASDFAALSPAAAKKAALAAFDAAVIDPHRADWQAVAYGLHAAMTAKRAAKAEEPTADGFLPWYYPDREAYPKGHTTRPRIDFVFADGVTVSAASWQKPGKPINIGLACRVALDFYRAKIRNRLHLAFPEAQIARLHSAASMGEGSPITVPAIVSATYRDTGETWNPATLNRETEAGRQRSLDAWEMLEVDDMEAAAMAVCMAFNPAVEAANKDNPSGSPIGRRAAAQRAWDHFVGPGSVEVFPLAPGDEYIGYICTTTRALRLLDAVETFEAMPTPSDAPSFGKDQKPMTTQVTTRRNHGPAFPHYAAEQYPPHRPVFSGMSRREYLAAHAPITMTEAVQAFGSHPNMLSDSERTCFMAVWAGLRYEYAEAMLAHYNEGS